jgi:hypothetical protein
MKKRMIVILMGIATFLGTVSSSALDVPNLSRALSEFAAANEWVKTRIGSEIAQPRLSEKTREKLAEMSEAQKAIEREVGRIETSRDLEKACKVASIYQKGQGSDPFVANHLTIMLQKRVESMGAKAPVAAAETNPSSPASGDR